uniref:WSD domain-containing protein n=1 Tax=Elaeophora elaphi TaxID=1147741 RepID=A0A0R3S725_9BILA
MYDIESMKRREQEKNDLAQQLQKRFSLYFKNVGPKLTPRSGYQNKKFCVLSKNKLFFQDEKRLAKELHTSDHVLQALDKNKLKTKKVLAITRLFQRAVKLGMVLNGANGTKLENKTLRFGSPRLLSVVPDDNKNQISILSPSLFSMHDKGKGLEALTSIPELLKVVGNRDYDEWLNFIMEASGTTDAIHKLKVHICIMMENVTEIDPEIVRKIDLFENLTYSLTSKQLMDFNRTGFSMMTPEQLTMIYGPQSPLNDSKALDFFISLSEDDMHRHLLNDIRNMAKIHSSLKIRRKRQNILAPAAFTTSILSPGAIRPSVLSPAAFALTILSPSIIGPSILSPGAFLATLLSPSVLSPAVLSPVAFAALILSPFALNPGVLSPAALAPSVLSPSALSPGIVSPSVLSPAIMSPFALNPSIFSPSALGALVASPFALSPSFFSPSYIAAVIFSPSAFSPSFNSTGRGVTVLFSPSVGS